MNNISLNNARTFMALMRREMKILKKNFIPTCIDSFILLMLNVLMVGYFFPRMGMPDYLIAPLYIGNIIFIIIEINFDTAFNLVFEIKEKGLITYFITLPLSTPWLCALYVAREFIKTVLLTIPLFFIGLLLLGPTASLVTFSYTTVVMYVLTILFFSFLFLFVSFWYSADWYLANIWPRRFMMLFSTGCVFFTWYGVSKFSPFVSRLLLLNPVTYVSEGLRESILHRHEFFSLWLCAAVQLALILLFAFLLSIGLKKRLDVV